MIALVHCNRCGKPCRSGTPINPDARLMRRAKTGLCVECCVVEFLQKLSNMTGGRLLSGIPGERTPAALRLPHIQKRFEFLMRAGNADAAPGEINWERVIEVWCVAPRTKGVLF